MAVGFCMPVSKEPPFVACNIGRDSFSAGLIRIDKEFVVNVLTDELKAKICYCGCRSEHQLRSFKQMGLTPHELAKWKCLLLASSYPKWNARLGKK